MIELGESLAHSGEISNRWHVEVSVQDHSARFGNVQTTSILLEGR